MTILAIDSFAGRSVSNGWGTASDGHIWTQLHIGSSVLVVSGGEGLAHGGFSNSQVLLGSGTTTDQEGLVRLALGQTGDSIGLILRSSSDGATYYYAEIGSFSNDISVRKVVSGSSSFLDVQAAGFTISNGSFYWMRFQVIDTTLKCKLWASGSTELSTWQSTVTDSAIASGQYGLFFNSFGSVDAQFDSYQATDTQASTPATRDASTRVRLLAVASPDLFSRLRLLALATRDLSTRLRLLSQKQADLPLRLRLSSLPSSPLNLFSRLRLLAGSQPNLFSRLRLLASAQRDTGTRVRLSAFLRRDLFTRLLLRPPTQLALATRLIFAPNPSTSPFYDTGVTLFPQFEEHPLT